MAKTNVVVEFEVANAFGKALPSPVKGSYTIPVVFETREEIPDGKRLNDDQYVNAVNAAEKAKLRAKATEAALKAAGFEKPDQNSPEVISENQVKLIMKLHNVSDAVARQIFEAQQKIAASLVAAQ